MFQTTHQIDNLHITIFIHFLAIWDRKSKLTCRGFGFLPSVLHWFCPLQIITPDWSGCFRRAAWRESFTRFFTWRESFPSFFMNFITIIIFQYTWHNFKDVYSIICQKISWRSWPMSEIINKTLHMTYDPWKPTKTNLLLILVLDSRLVFWFRYQKSLW